MKTVPAWLRRGAAQALAILCVGGAATWVTYLVRGEPRRLFFCDRAALKPGEVCLADVPRDTRVIWVDARTREEWETNGLSGSLLWSLEGSEDPKEFEAALAVKLMEVPDVIVYCGGEDCSLSHQVAGKIRGIGMGANVRVLRGGWRALSEAGWIKDRNSTAVR
ncbi:MAG: rhodanese-like domain-containing protein [Verrucomicrobiota bacterium]